MHKNEKCAILDEVDEAMYLTTIEDYKLIFMNERLKQMTNVKGEEYIDLPCYKVIHNLDSPCEFCKNFKINKETFVSKEKYIDHFKGYFNIKAKSIELNDEIVRLIIADDVTDIETRNQEIQRRFKAEESIFNYINNLGYLKDLDKSINIVLGEIANYYKADRGYIFRVDNKNKTLSNTYEYNSVGVIPQINNLQNLPIGIIDRWIGFFKTQGYVCISSLNGDLDPNSDEYKILAQQEVDSLLVYPFYMEGNLIGFIGVDNPKYDTSNITVLKSISFFIFYELFRSKQMKKLEILSSYDSLTGLKNRNSYINYLENLENQHPDNVGIIYIDLNGLKEANDQFGHEYGDLKLKSVAEVMKKYFESSSFRIGGDEFVIIISNIEEKKFVKTLNELLHDINSNNSINVSIGYIYEYHPLSIETLVKKADGLMYEEKQKYYERVKH